MRRATRRSLLGSAAVLALTAGGLLTAGALGSSASAPAKIPDRSNQTASPIKHLVVIFDENVSYDHYFGTYPHAANTDGTRFYPVTSTPRNNNLVTSGLLTSNPNLYAPTRLTPSEALTCDQNHNYGPEQLAANNGAMDKVVQYTSVDTCTGMFQAPGLAMDYFDGNTVTAMWNYAQQYALSDNFYDSNFGPSTPGAINLASGNTHGFRAVDPTTLQPVTDSYAIFSPDANGVGTMINDPDPAYDDCSNNDRTSTNSLTEATGDKNIGDLLNARGVTWGWFQGGFRPTTPASDSHPYAACAATHENVGGYSQRDYSPHHEPFQYYASTANPHHLPPKNVAETGHNGQANHQYDLTDFTKAVKASNLPAVSFLKAASYQDGHAGYSDPTDEQHFLVKEINLLERSPQWSSTAVVIAYDDSDGWYDHVAPVVTNGGSTSTDAAICTDSGAPIAGGYQGRCGPGPRLPLLVISPYAKTNYVGHAPIEQASIIKFVEDNWFMPRVGDHSFDARARSMKGLFDFTQSNNKRVILNQRGAVTSITPIRHGTPMQATAVLTKAS
ncbi:Phosphoesterase [Nostocoides japonicum T1-X7]|uniref:phospholipase C n=1 Tax=Nostocoides japonicum T1-X7 TaxID=1194083 RepID=A0A077LXP4_9MICO|nr:alkaline phosphatase family protein [Tetrasphaera japonica]CCH77662.1 Phosphoesterase [Tetrasphaera japonica T1-X7]